MRQDTTEPGPDARWLSAALHAAFVLLLGGAVARLLTHEPDGGARTWWVLALFLGFGLLYLAGQLWAPAPGAGERPTAWHLCWLGAVLAVWVLLLALEPSATWCAMPLLFTGLHRLPVRFAIPLAALLVVLVVVSEIRVRTAEFNPNLVIAPVGLGTVATAVLVHSRRQTERQRRLIDELVRTRGELAAAERHAGVLAERARLSTEIHDLLAQSLSSQQMLLQAAQRHRQDAPQTAHAYVDDAAGASERALAEVRRFVRDLTPLDLAEGTLVQALRNLAQPDGTPGPLVEFRLDAERDLAHPLPATVETALLRVAQQALANAREHARASRIVLTLTCLEDGTTVDIADDGCGFDAGQLPFRHRSSGRGQGLAGMRRRAHRAGGTLAVETTPGAGTVVTLSVPVAASLATEAPDDATDAVPEAGEGAGAVAEDEATGEAVAATEAAERSAS